jgi:F420-non-reducing hydrogenase iron-sulfur subunit
MRLQYPAEIETIMVPGTGRVDILPLLKALENGTDAVLVAGCLEGECHYLTGNLQAKKRVHKLKKDVSQMGLEPERLEMFNLSSSDGPRWAASCQEMSHGRPGSAPAR